MLGTFNHVPVQSPHLGQLCVWQTFGLLTAYTQTRAFLLSPGLYAQYTSGTVRKSDCCLPKSWCNTSVSYINAFTVSRLLRRAAGSEVGLVTWHCIDKVTHFKSLCTDHLLLFIRLACDPKYIRFSHQANKCIHGQTGGSLNHTLEWREKVI